MKGFILAQGWSGTTWVAYALSECAGLDARHESMRHSLGADFGGVEVNGNFWHLADEIRDRYNCPVLHLVRDGRLVVRSHMARKPRHSFERACRRWRNRNQRLLRDCPVFYRLENLTTYFTDFALFAYILGAPDIREDQWKRIRTQKKNPNRFPHRIPPPEEWDDKMTETFWKICGKVMEECGYSR